MQPRQPLVTIPKNFASWFCRFSKIAQVIPNFFGGENLLVFRLSMITQVIPIFFGGENLQDLNTMPMILWCPSSAPGVMHLRGTLCGTLIRSDIPPLESPGWAMRVWAWVNC